MTRKLVNTAKLKLSPILKLWGITLCLAGCGSVSVPPQPAQTTAPSGAIIWQCSDGTKLPNVKYVAADLREIETPHESNETKSRKVSGYFVPKFQTDQGEVIRLLPGYIEKVKLLEVDKSQIGNPMLSEMKESIIGRPQIIYSVEGNDVNLRRNPGTDKENNPLERLQRGWRLIGSTKTWMVDGRKWILVGKENEQKAIGFVASEYLRPLKLIAPAGGQIPFWLACDERQDEDQTGVYQFPYWIGTYKKSNLDKRFPNVTPVMNFTSLSINHRNINELSNYIDVFLQNHPRHSPLLTYIGEPLKVVTPWRRYTLPAIVSADSSVNPKSAQQPLQQGSNAPKTNLSTATTRPRTTSTQIADNLTRSPKVTTQSLSKPFELHVYREAGVFGKRALALRADEIFSCRETVNRWCELYSPRHGWVNLGYKYKTLKNFSLKHFFKTRQYLGAGKEYPPGRQPVSAQAILNSKNLGELELYPVPSNAEYAYAVFSAKHHVYYVRIPENYSGMFSATSSTISAGSSRDFGDTQRPSSETMATGTRPEPLVTDQTAFLSRIPTGVSSFLMKLKLPKLLPSTFVRVTPHISGCGFEKMIGKEYLFSCKRQVPYELKISPFSPTDKLNMRSVNRVIHGADFVVSISPQYLIGWFYASISDNTRRYYRFQSERMQATTSSRKSGLVTVGLPLSLLDLEKPIFLRYPGVKDCDFRLDINVGNMFVDAPLSVVPKCVSTVVDLPDRMPLPLKASGCLATSKHANGFLCISLNRKLTKAVFDWGKGWINVPVNLRRGNYSVIVEKNRIRPLWPFMLNDPWLDPKMGSEDQCETVPTFRPLYVQYCARGRCSKKGSLKTAGGRIVLPALEDLSLANGRFPDEVKVIFQKVSKSPNFPKTISATWSPAKSTPKRLNKSVKLPKPEKEFLPIRIGESEITSSDTNARILIFDSQKECKKAVGPKGSNWRPYHPGAIRDLKAHGCSFAKVRKGDRDLTACSRPKRRGKVWVYDLIQGEQFPGRRQVLLVANTQEFKSKGRTVFDAIYKWLKELKAKDSKQPFTLMSVQPDGTIRTIIRAEELRGLKDSSGSAGVATIRKRVKERLKFNGSGLRPLENLQDFEEKLQDNVDRILYVTGATFPADSDVRGSDLGTPLNWKLNGVKFGVMTVKRCQFWKEVAKAVSCGLIGRKPKDRMYKVIKKFFSG